MYSNGLMNTSPFYSLNPFAHNYLVLTFVKNLGCFAVQFFHCYFTIVCHQNSVRLLANSADLHEYFSWNMRLIRKQTFFFFLILVNIERIFLWLLRWNGVYPNLLEIWCNSRNITQVLEKAPLWPSAVWRVDLVKMWNKPQNHGRAHWFNEKIYWWFP